MPDSIAGSANTKVATLSLAPRSFQKNLLLKPISQAKGQAMSFLIFVLVVGLALFARLHRTDWRVWAGLAGGALVSLVSLYLASVRSEEARGVTLTAIALGLLGPEIWHATRRWVGDPKNLKYVVLGAVGIFGLIYPPILGALMSLGIMWVGLRVVLGAMGGKKKT